MKKKILIDNGHGENTPGKRSPDGRLREYKYTRDVAQQIATRLLRMGYDAERIVTEDMDVSLGERVRRINAHCKKHGAGNVLLVSVHCNAAGKGRWENGTGWECFTTRGVTAADRLASCLYAAAKKNFNGMKIREDWSDNDADKEADFYIIKNTACPAVLTENFFMDNQEDMEYMLSPAGREAVIRTHVEGIVDFVSKNNGNKI